MNDKIREALVTALDELTGSALNFANNLRPDYSNSCVSHSDIDNQNNNVQGTHHEHEHPTVERPTITMTNDDALHILAGSTMGISDLDGVEYNVRLATADELEAGMRASSKKYGTSTPDAGWRYHAERLSQAYPDLLSWRP